MKITVIGKEHREGKSSKTGRDYNSNVVHYLGKARGVEGVVGKSAWLDPVSYPMASIDVGLDYNIEFDERGYVMYFCLAEN